MGSIRLELRAVVVPARFTVWVNTADVLPLKLVSPPYTPVIECVPPERPDVENVAVPLLLSCEEPRAVLPSMNVTLPVGVPVPPVTVAVNITDCP